MGTGAMPDVMLARAAGLELGETGGVALLAPTSRPPRAACGPPATCASTTPCCTAAASGSSTSRSRARRARRRRRRCSARAGRTPRCRTSGPTCRTGAPRSGSGSTEAPEQEIVRGVVGDGAFSVLHLAGGRLVAALSVGRDDDLAHARRLIAAGTDLAGREAELADGDLDDSSARRPAARRRRRRRPAARARRPRRRGRCSGRPAT